MELFSQGPFKNILDVAAPPDNIVVASSDMLQATELTFEDPVPLKVVKDVQVDGDDTSDVGLNINVAMAEDGEPATPIEPKSTGVVIIDSSSRDVK